MMNFTRSDRKKYSITEACRYIAGTCETYCVRDPNELRTRLAWLEWRVDAGWDDSRMHYLSEYEAAVRAMAREVVKLGKALVMQLDDYNANRAKTEPK